MTVEQLQLKHRPITDKEAFYGNILNFLEWTLRPKIKGQENLDAAHTWLEQAGNSLLVYFAPHRKLFNPVVLTKVVESQFLTSLPNLRFCWIASGKFALEGFKN